MCCKNASNTNSRVPLKQNNKQQLRLLIQTDKADKQPVRERPIFLHAFYQIISLGMHIFMRGQPLLQTSRCFGPFLHNGNNGQETLEKMVSRHTY